MAAETLATAEEATEAFERIDYDKRQQREAAAQNLSMFFEEVVEPLPFGD